MQCKQHPPTRRRRYGFNPGSALAILGRSDVAALAAVNTTLSAAAGTLSTLFILMAMEFAATGEPVWDLLGSANGTLAGLVGITAGCHVVEVRLATAPIGRSAPCQAAWHWAHASREPPKHVPVCGGSVQRGAQR